jgi:TPR repeat protein
MRESAQKGDAEAQHEMADFFRNDEGDDESNELSFQFERSSAEQGYIPAYNNLAVHYDEGIGTNADQKMAFYWYKKAAENGNTNAKYNLPTYYMEGKVTPQNNNQAFYWAEQAANDGYVKAKTKLGAFYIEGIGVSPDKEKGLSLLHEAAASGDELAKEVIQEISDEEPDYDDIFGALEGTVEDVKYLVEKKGADVNAIDDQGYTPLHAALFLEKYDIAKYLVSAGADVNAKDDNNGFTPLHLAASDGNVEVAKQIVSAGADVNAKNNNGCTPLDGAEDSTMKQYLKSIGGKAAIPSTGQIVGKVLLDEAKSSIGRCYIATAVYGSYDCPQVWTLRRYRDNALASNFFGRAFINIYYTISPTIVKIAGNARWFTRFCRNRLDKLVYWLQKIGYEDTPYIDCQR